MPKSGVNPFRPGRGVLPPMLAGRDQELGAADRCLAELLHGISPSQDLLFHGPRGNGKTVLLLEIERRARNRDFRVEALPVDALTDRAALVRALQERAGALGGQVTGVQPAGVGATTTPRQPTEDSEQLFAAWLRKEAFRPMVLVVDEAQSLAPEAARPFFSAVQSAKSGPVPFLLVCAGTPDAPRRIRQAGTFNERGFHQFRVGLLDRTATLAALREPARASGRPFTEDAAEFLAEQSQDYPFFIQLLGRAAWKSAAEGASEISLRDARTGASESAGHIEDFYEGRYREAEARRVEPVLTPLASLISEHGGSLTDSQLDPLLRRFAGEPEIPFDDLSLRDELSNLGLLWSVRTAVWEMGIPSFADYLLRRG